jgi:glyoxylase-like metal-dependent hydrolase (beta-lactamase superfamily II)/rhodanese-related sulfurtransferase
MKIEQIYTGCLAEAAYYIESNGEALIIDPLRETKPYIEKAKANGASIKYILETHFHADFVSGHVELAQKTGATIVFGPTAQPAYSAHIATDGEILKLGKISIQVLHTPGHTMESTTFLLRDENEKPVAIFTGDTLFIGDVGRPDLVQKVKAEITPAILAGHLYDSLREKIMTLPDDIIVYPGHGAGSACGKNMSKETTDTLGNQKKVNYALEASLTKEAFIKAVTDGLVEPPQYFPHNVIMNVTGGLSSIDDIIQIGTTALDPQAFQLVREAEEALVIDTRDKSLFPKGFIPGSIFIGLDDNFAPWAGALITDLKQPILLVADNAEKAEEAVIRLSRVGYDHSLGFLKGGLEAWKNAGNEVETLAEIDAESFAKLYNPSSIHLLDARKESEYQSQHIEGAMNFPLDFINQNMSMLDKNQQYYVHCAGGYRSVITASILKSRGFENLVNIQGGFKALSATNLHTTVYQAPETML